MQPAERFAVAQRVVAKLADISPEFGPSVYGPLVASRVSAVLTAIDAAAAAADCPLLVAELLPSIDVIVARDFGQPAPRAAVDAPSLDSIWEDDTVSPEWIAVLTDLVTSALANASAGANEPGAWHHQGADGLHYFVFDAQYRSQALQQLGIEEGDLVMVSPTANEAA